MTQPGVNGGSPVTTTFCYNYADQVIGSSDSTIGVPEYDDHGNTTKLGAGTTTQLEFGYDATDKNTQLLQVDPSTGNGLVSQYERDVQGRITKRTTFSIANWSWNTTSTTNYGFSGSGDSPDFVRDNSWNVTEKYLTLAGGATLTIRPSAPQASNQYTYSLRNVHGYANTKRSDVAYLKISTLSASPKLVSSWFACKVYGASAVS